MKPICVPCQRFYRPKHNGFYFIEGMPRVNGAPPGKERPGQWKPYKMWCGDVWECHGCGAIIIVGTGQGPVAEHYEPDFSGHVMKACGPTPFQVNDC